MAADRPPIMIRCIIADDEPLARKGVQQLVQQVPYFQLTGVAKDALEANDILLRDKADLIFLDIQMPKLTGIEFLKTLKDPPRVIFTTAWPEYAIEGYELDVLDYLLKPITLPRFLKAAAKARDFFELQSLSKSTSTEKGEAGYLFVKTNKLLQKVLFDEIVFIEAMLNYVIIHSAGEKIITYTSMKNILDMLPAESFIKVHKSYIISVRSIRSIEGNEVVLGDQRLPVSRTHKDELLKAIAGKRL
jgi:two-component system, LytTR family, response regulator